MRRGRSRIGNVVARARTFLETSLWPFPAVAMVLAFALAVVLLRADAERSADAARWYLFGGETESAREVLSTIASSLLTFTGLVFSITVLVLQQASTQFSSRVLRTFLSDRTTRLTMATFVGSFVFALVILTRIRNESGDDEAFVPALSVSMAFALLIASVAVFIRYISHMAHSIRAVDVVTRVADETRESLDRMYPTDFLHEPPVPLAPPRRPPDAVVRHERRGGVLIEVDEEALTALAKECGGVIALVPFVGDFVPEGGEMFRIWSGEPPTSEDLGGCVVFGMERTPRQDTAFGFRELVDVAERALSPGINDQTTAVQALDHLHELLRLLATREIPAAERTDERGRLLLVLPRPDWDAYVHLALDEICQYGGGSIQVQRRVRALIEDVLEVAPPSRRFVLRRQLAVLDAAVERSFGTEEERRRARQPSVQGQGEQPSTRGDGSPSH